MSYPATLQIETPDRIANWRPIVQWILAIPHFILLWVLQSVSAVVSLISWLVILVTGRLPVGLADFQAMALRYELRVIAYASFLHDEYPPFAFDTTSADPGGTPVTANYSPALEGRNRLTVLLRIIWMIPAMIFSLIISVIAYICGILGFFAVLITGRWPAGLLRWVVASLVVGNRLNAYFALLTDEYPPFEVD